MNFRSCWLISNGELLSTFTRTTNGVFRAIAFSTNGQVSAAASLDKTISLWDVGREFWVRNLEGHSAGVLCVEFSLDGEVLVSGAEDGT